MAAYRKLVYETDGFTDYFFASTPIAEIAELMGGVARAQASMASNRKGFPDPVARLASGPVFIRREVEAWVEANPIKRRPRAPESDG